MNENYPVFLSKIATGEDKFEGKSQENLAKVISNVINEENLEKKILGLEGDWGAGKTNLIKIIQSKLGKDYHTFIFDAWGSQEDLTRKSFLEQLINELFEAEYLTNKEKWKELKNRLLSTTSTTHTQKFPQIKRHVLILSFSILVLSILSGTYEYIGQHFDFITSQYYGYWKPILWIYLLPFLIFLLGIRLTWLEYKRERQLNSRKDLIEQDTEWQTIGKLFYWFNGDDINSEEVQNIIEDDPSVKQFREYFKNIEDEIKDRGKLILVFDNLDRLEEDKLKSLWSSIHTFFAEDNNSFDSWVIIPYDRSKLSSHLDDGFEGFIGKTFSLNFRVTPPVVRQWEKFLDEKLDKAFGKKLLTMEEREFILKLFDILTPTTTIKPRQIINYINDIVSLYKIWEKDIKNHELKIRYLALFVLTKDEIVNNPHDSILNRNYLDGAESFFSDDEDLDTSISMITFGVRKDLADEVLLDRKLKNAIRHGDTQIIKSSIHHKAFQKYFIKAYYETSFIEKSHSLAIILPNIKEVFSDIMMNTFWEDFGKGILTLENEFWAFNDNHRAILKNTNNKIGTRIIFRLIKALYNNLNSEESQNKYVSQLIEIEKYIKKESIEIDIFEITQNTSFSSKAYLNFLKSVEDNYDDFKIDCPENELIELFIPENGDINIDLVEKHIDELIKVREVYNFEEITQGIQEKVKSIPYNDNVLLERYLKILNGLLDPPVKLELSLPFYRNLTTQLIDSNSIYIDACCIAISNFLISYSNSSNFQNTLTNFSQDQIRKLSEKIEQYFSYNDLLKLKATRVETDQYPKLNDLLFELTTGPQTMKNVDINWVIENLEKIKSKVFDEEEKLSIFIENIDAWHKEFTLEIPQCSNEIFGFFGRSDLKLIELIIEKTLEYFNGLSKDNLLISFREENKDFLILKSLINNYQPKSFSAAFYSAYDDFIKGIALGDENIPNIGIWDRLINLMDEKKLRSTFTVVRDILFNQRGELTEADLYFLEKGLIKYGNLNKKPESATLKILIPLIESDSNFENIFLERLDECVSIINMSKEHKDSAISELQLKYDSKKFNDNAQLKKLVKIFQLRENVDISDEEE
ncbi:P-loop NTPase fold protein [Flagellimonas zhangzhouensis]|uniref:KAP family P-loop domain-containing protein n=1 Tax=Flagellimonas zhangzhouensis TaxID=1073328 RepID=A0A1H2SGQ7_9FLAO|nr:P-loop NTPase fold protein [Allomuricauda zhangzhouensis]SDQ74667.1 KAP family P-loop domain-containing protein [Allomuricauda zhangzhouensis]SDW30883.1 KAP family P-loop domain-containing protein [Allomuricauda zhangzhouensis]